MTLVNYVKKGVTIIILVSLLLPALTTNVTAVDVPPSIDWYEPYNETIGNDILPDLQLNITNISSGTIFSYAPEYPGNWYTLHSFTANTTTAQITLDHNKVPETFTGFPVLIRNTSDLLKDTDHGGVVNMDGSNIEFWNSDNSSQYFHEIEFYNGSTGTLVSWVNITSLSSLVDTVINMRFNGTQPFNVNATKVWDNNYQAVYHMNATSKESGVPIWDSTENHFSLYQYGDLTGAAIVTGIAGKAVNVSDDYFVDVNRQLSYNMSNYSTVEVWANAGFQDTNSRYIISNLHNGGLSYPRMSLFQGSSSSTPVRADSLDNDNDGVYGLYGGFEPWDGDWNYLSVTRVNRTHLRFVYNQSEVTLYNKTDDYTDHDTDLNFTSNQQFVIGNYYNGTPTEVNSFRGILDEVRLSKTPRSQEWLNMTYESIVNYSTFTSFSYSESNAYVNVSVQDQNATTPNTKYYWRVELNSAGGWTNETFEFTTFELDEPTAVTTTAVNGTSLNLSWTNFSTSHGYDLSGNVTTIVRYSDTSYPTAMDEGTAGYNGTSNYVVLTGLTQNQKYYFSLWSGYNKTSEGSTKYQYYSTDYATTSHTLTGGIYNISVKWEGNDTLLAPADGNWGKFLNSSMTIMTLYGEQILYNDTFTTNPFSVEINQTPDLFSFNFNGEGLIRSVTPDRNESNIIFYVSDKALYDGVSTNYSDYQYWYTFDFEDYTPGAIFMSSPESKLYFYLFNESSGKYFVHQDFLSASDTVTAPLEYGKRYYLGIECNESYIPFLQYIDTSSDLSFTVNIYSEIEDVYFIDDLVDFNISRNATQFWLNYTDYSHSTTNSTIFIYRTYKNNNTKILLNTSTSTLDTYAKTWTEVNEQYNYYIEVVINSTLFDDEQSIYTISVSTYITVTPKDVGPINTWFNEAFGLCPFHPVSWAQSFTFGIFMIALIGAGWTSRSAEIAMFFAAFITIITSAFLLYDATMKGVIISAAIFMLIFSAVAYIKRHRQEDRFR